MTEVLKAEGERSLALGNQRILFEVHPDGTTKSVHKQIGLIFTAGTFDTYGIAQVGDLIQANQPIRTPAYNVRQPELPAETLIQSIPVAAARKCDELATQEIISGDRCGSYSGRLSRSGAPGEPVVHAETVA